MHQDTSQNLDDFPPCNCSETLTAVPSSGAGLSSTGAMALCGGYSQAARQAAGSTSIWWGWSSTNGMLQAKALGTLTPQGQRTGTVWKRRIIASAPGGVPRLSV